jgi:hypothetical protein
MAITRASTASCGRRLDSRAARRSPTRTPARGVADRFLPNFCPTQRISPCPARSSSAQPSGFPPQRTPLDTSHNPKVAGSNPAPAIAEPLRSGSGIPTGFEDRNLSPSYVRSARRGCGWWGEPHPCPAAGVVRPSTSVLGAKPYAAGRLLRAGGEHALGRWCTAARSGAGATSARKPNDRAGLAAAGRCLAISHPRPLGR